MPNFEERKKNLTREHGPWVAHNIITPEGYTMFPEIAGDHYRLQRFLQATSDVSGKQFSELRVVDFGCHEGLYSIEFARQGARVVGIEGRDVHLTKARFIQDELSLSNLDFVCDDVRNFTVDKYGRFDVAICTGILYHLGGEDGLEFLREVIRSSELVIIDTHVGLSPSASVSFNGREYFGHIFHEPKVNESDKDDVLKNNGASIGNSQSFWLTRQDLYNAMSDFGCTTVAEIGIPYIPNQFFDRVSFIGYKGKPVNVLSAPGDINKARERHAKDACLLTAGQSLPRYD